MQPLWIKKMLKYFVHGMETKLMKKKLSIIQVSTLKLFKEVDISQQFFDNYEYSLFDCNDIRPLPLDYIGYKLESIVNFLKNNNFTIKDSLCEYEIIDIFLNYVNENHSRPKYYSILNKIKTFKNINLKEKYKNFKIYDLYNLTINEMIKEIKVFINVEKNILKIKYPQSKEEFEKSTEHLFKIRDFGRIKELFYIILQY